MRLGRVSGNRHLYLGNNGNIAYVASTLPVGILRRRARDWQIGTVLVASPSLGKSYEYLTKECHHIHIIVLPQTQVRQLLALAYHIFVTRVLGRHIFFFHECCCLNFDIIIGFIKPKGSHFPQVTLNSFTRVTAPKWKSRKEWLVFSLLRRTKCFVPYLRDLDDDQGTGVIWARAEYPTSIKRYTVEDSHVLKATASPTLSEARTNNILFLLGSEVAQNSVMQNLYKQVIDYLSHHNLTLYAKDHPNPQSRLNLADARLIHVDPYKPVELLTEQFDFVIGAASTGLLLFGNRAISILRFEEMQNETTLRQRINHLLSMPGGDKVNLPRSIKELGTIILRTQGRDYNMVG